MVCLCVNTRMPVEYFEMCHYRHLTNPYMLLMIILPLYSMLYMIGSSSPGRGWEFFYSPPRPDRLWGPLSLLFSGYQGSLPGGKPAVASHLHLVPRSKNEWSYTFIPPIVFHSVVLS
jgi:hypothetical protein